MSMPESYNYSAYSSGQPAPQVTEPARPAAVDRGFWLLIASAVVNIIGAVISFVVLSSDEGRSELARVSGLTAAEADTAATIGIVTGVVVAIISVAVSVLFAIFARKGHNWARIIITVFAALSLFSLIGVNGSAEGILTLVSVLLPIVAVVLFFTAPASAYFNQMQQYRQARKMGGYAG